MLNISKTISEFETQEITLEILHEIKSGKEATVFCVLANGELRALKVYKINDNFSYNRYNAYTAGSQIMSRTLRQSIKAKNQVGLAYIESSRTKREFDMLQKFYAHNANVPKVYAYNSNAILMELIGDEKNVAPKLKFADLSFDNAQNAFEDIINSIVIFYENYTVHGDLSPYNILYWQGKIYIIDFPQMINTQTNPNTYSILKRDLDNIINYFEKYFYIDRYEIYNLFGI